MQPLLDHLSKLHDIERIVAEWGAGYEGEDGKPIEGYCYDIKCKDGCEACEEDIPFAEYDR